MTTLLFERLEPLMDKPGWQRVLLLLTFILTMVSMSYLLGLRGMWRQQEELKLQMATVQRAVLQTQAALMLAPPLENLERELQSNATRLADLPLAQQFAQPLKDSQARLMRWQPAPAVKTKTQGELQLQLSFSELTYFLYALLQRPEHPVFGELNLHRESTGLNASVVLTQTKTTGVIAQDAVAIIAVRDPFAEPGSSLCSGNAPGIGWSLSGVSHVEGKRFGWLLAPDGLWAKVESGSQFGVPQWTVETLDASQVELRLSDTRCGVRRQVIRLGKDNYSPGKGNHEIR